MLKDSKYLGFLRSFSIVEGISTLLLFFVAMPLKYAFDMPLAVTIFGSLHGLLFMALVGLYFVALDRVPLPMSTMILGIIGAVIPFGPFFVDRRLKKLADISS
jgi:integral membrane protein